MIVMTKITLGGFSIGGKSTELNPFSIVSQVIRYSYLSFPANLTNLR